MRNAGAVIHSHGIEACLATMINPSATEFRVTTIMWRDGWMSHVCLGSHVSFLWTTTTTAEDSTKVSMKRKTGIQLEFLWNPCIWFMIMLWLSFCKEEKERKLAYVQHSLKFWETTTLFIMHGLCSVVAPSWVLPPLKNVFIFCGYR